jgi:putative transposase
VALQRWTLRRLDEAFAGFFRRAKARNGKAGFPRLRGKGRWTSFGFAEFSGIGWDGKRLRFKGMPSGLSVHLHRPLPPDADIPSCVFRRDRRGWHVAIAVEAAEKRAVADAIGVDLGLRVFAYCSDGVILPNPRRRRSGNCAAGNVPSRGCKRGSNRRKKVGEHVDRLIDALDRAGSMTIPNSRATTLLVTARSSCNVSGPNATSPTGRPRPRPCRRN